MVKMTALNRKLFRNLWHQRGQIAAVTLVVACGIATYITMRGAYDSLVAAQTSYYTGYRFADVFAHLKRAPESLAAEIARINGVLTVQTRLVADVTIDVPGLDEPATGRLISIPGKRVAILNDIHILQGRYIEPGQRDEVIISEGFAEANGLRIGHTINAIINGRWEQLSIVGIAISPEYINEVRSSGMFPDKRRFGILWMERKAIAAALDMDGAFNNLSLLLSPGASAQSVIDELDRKLGQYGGAGAYGREEQLSHRFLTDEIKQDRVTSIFIPSIFLGVAAFLINIVLARLVSTQRNQIAVLKAFGYSDLRIGVHYLLFSLVAIVIGAILGIGLGIWLGTGLAQLYKKFFNFPSLQFQVQPDMVAVAVLISAAAAIFGAITAVRRVVKLPPAESMRPEPPAKFHAGLLDRIGLQRLLSPASRMIIRNLERRSLKALLSVIGIAFAVAILVVGRYSIDALDYIIEVHYRNVQREDVAVYFNNPRPADTQYELTRLTGVLRSEPFRMVPARLRFEHCSKRIGILGLTANGQLRNLMDSKLRHVDLPPEGIVLSEKLAEIVQVKAGDIITLEILEGQRAVRQVEVVRLVDELIGISAYMDIEALNRLLRENDTLSGTFLSVDPRFAKSLYAQLKQTPAVGSVEIREAMLASFLDTIAENITISTTMLITFACVIAFAVVYNSARIALSERGHEMASLRVLGFSQGEVGLMLLGEQAILTLIALPVGYAIGYATCAALTKAFESEVYRMPLVISGRTYAFAFMITCAAAFLSGLLVLLRLNRLDLVEALKSRE
jgi:putative ABC transport system permease protein